jgi:hypothetical protein
MVELVLFLDVLAWTSLGIETYTHFKGDEHNETRKRTN